jgi:RES domain-containing protein
VYTAESRALASLEVLVHTEDTQVLAAIDWIAIPVSFDQEVIEIPGSLPADWHRLPAPQSTGQWGNRWVAEERSVVLRVPSVVVKGEFNYLINPRHRDFGRLVIGSALPFSFDPRLAPVS